MAAMAVPTDTAMAASMATTTTIDRAAFLKTGLPEELSIFFEKGVLLRLRMNIIENIFYKKNSLF